MEIISQLNTITALNLLAGIENVIIRDDENNHYEDSDFYYVGVNIKSNTYFKHVHSTTRFGGYSPLPKAIMINQLSEGLQNKIRSLFEDVTRKEAINVIQNDTVIKVGDKVQVTNTRARYHKQALFTVDRITHYRDRFDRVQTVYLHGTDEQGQTVKTSASNCSMITAGEDHINHIAERLRLGLRTR